MSVDDSTRSNKEIKTEQHSRNFRGTHAAPELHRLVESRKLSPTAAWFAMVIHAYSKGPQGCFASNRYLGTRIHKCTRQVQRLLQKMEQCGILKTEWREGTRFLIVCLEGKPKLTHSSYQEYLQSDHWKRVREKALQRSKYRCQLCNSGKNLNVHHRTYENLGCEQDDDLIALCRRCHEKHHDILKEGGVA